MEENVENEPGTLVWKLNDTNGETLGELIVAWGAAEGDMEARDWSRQLAAWRVAPFLPGEYVLEQQRIDEDQNVDGLTPYVRTAQAAEIWNDHVLENGVQPGTTAAEFRGEVGPIPGFVYGDEEEAQ